MRKELLVVILGGFLLGLVIMGGILTANQAVNYSKNNTLTPETNTIPTPTPTLFFLTILKPENQSIVTQDKIIVSGNTLPNLPVVFLWEKGENILQSDENGNFDAEIPLIAGVNDISLSAFTKEGDEVTKSVSIVYSKDGI